MIVRRILAILTVIATLWAPVAHAQSVTGTVTRVVDGDTVDVRVDGKVERIRIIGLDTPETVDPRKAVQCFGREASAHAKELLPLGTPVTLEADPTQDSRDKYGRMLAFILFETDPCTIANFTEVMIAGGYGHHYVYRRPSIYADAFSAAQDYAQYWGPFGRNVPEDAFAVEACEKGFAGGGAAFQIIAREENMSAQDDGMLRAWYAEWARRMDRLPGDPVRREGKGS